MIKFTDGTEISWENAAGMIEAEGRVFTDLWCSTKNERCATGVIEGWRYNNGSFETHRTMLLSSLDSIIGTNDGFEGTPEERAVYMAEWCRRQDD